MACAWKKHSLCQPATAAASGQLFGYPSRAIGFDIAHSIACVSVSHRRARRWTPTILYIHGVALPALHIIAKYGGRHHGDTLPRRLYNESFCLLHGLFNSNFRIPSASSASVKEAKSKHRQLKFFRGTIISFSHGNYRRAQRSHPPSSAHGSTLASYHHCASHCGFYCKYCQCIQGEVRRELEGECCRTHGDLDAGFT